MSTYSKACQMGLITGDVLNQIKNDMWNEWEQQSKEVKGYIVYMLYRKRGKSKKLVYIGKTKNLVQRIQQHKDEGKKNFNHVEYVKFNSESEQGFGEIYLINKYKPEYNKGDKWKGDLPFIIDLYENLKWKEYYDYTIEQYREIWITNHIFNEESN